MTAATSLRLPGDLLSDIGRTVRGGGDAPNVLEAAPFFFPPATYAAKPKGRAKDSSDSSSDSSGDSDSDDDHAVPAAGDAMEVDEPPAPPARSLPPSLPPERLWYRAKACDALAERALSQLMPLARAQVAGGATTDHAYAIVHSALFIGASLVRGGTDTSWTQRLAMPRINAIGQYEKCQQAGNLSSIRHAGDLNYRHWADDDEDASMTDGRRLMGAHLNNVLLLPLLRRPQSTLLTAATTTTDRNVSLVATIQELTRLATYADPPMPLNVAPGTPLPTVPSLMADVFTRTPLTTSDPLAVGRWLIYLPGANQYAFVQGCLAFAGDGTAFARPAAATTTAAAPPKSPTKRLASVMAIAPNDDDAVVAPPAKKKKKKEKEKVVVAVVTPSPAAAAMRPVHLPLASTIHQARDYQYAHANRLSFFFTPSWQSMVVAASSLTSRGLLATVATLQHERTGCLDLGPGLMTKILDGVHTSSPIEKREKIKFFFIDSLYNGPADDADAHTLDRLRKSTAMSAATLFLRLYVQEEQVQQQQPAAQDADNDNDDDDMDDWKRALSSVTVPGKKATAAAATLNKIIPSLVQAPGVKVTPQTLERLAALLFWLEFLPAKHAEWFTAFRRTHEAILWAPAVPASARTAGHNLRLSLSTAEPPALFRSTAPLVPQIEAQETTVRRINDFFRLAIDKLDGSAAGEKKTRLFDCWLMLAILIQAVLGGPLPAHPLIVSVDSYGLAQ